MIVLNASPSTYQSAHDDILFVAYEATKATDNTAYPDYRYVLDIYINGELAARQKAYPQPDNYRGVFNIGRIVRNYLGTVFNPTLSQIRAQQFGDGKYYVDVTCKFGEDYDFTLYTNILVDSVRRYFNNYLGRQSATILSSYLDKFATNAPLIKTVEFTDIACLVPYLPSSSGDITLSVTAGGTTQTKTIHSAKDTIEQLNLSPAAINAEWSGLITTSTPYYTTTIGSQTFRFNIKCNTFTTYWVHFLNKLGAYDSFPFRLVNRQSFEVEKKSFGQLPYTIGDDGVASYSTGVTFNSTNKTYASQSVEKMKLNTDWLTDEEWVWLKELVQSPEVFIQEDGYFIPVAVMTSNYEVGSYIVDGLRNLEIDIEFGRKQNTQYR